MIRASSENFGICTIVRLDCWDGCRAFPRLFSNTAIRRTRWFKSGATMPCELKKELGIGLLPCAAVIKEEVNKLADIYFDGVSECFMGCLMIIIYDVPEPSDGSLV